MDEGASEDGAKEWTALIESNDSRSCGGLEIPRIAQTPLGILLYATPVPGSRGFCFEVELAMPIIRS